MEVGDLKISKIDVKKELEALYMFDAKVAKANPTLLARDGEEWLLSFLTKEHNSETWAWKTESGSLVGYISLIDKPKENALEVLRICVDPLKWRRKLGTKMMVFAEKMALKLGRKKVDLATNKANAQSIAFYKKLGYRIAKEVENYYGEGEVRYIFEKVLS